MPAMQTTSSSIRRYRLLSIGVAATAIALSAPSHASGVKAGTIIRNTASATFETGTGSTTIESNTVDLRVDEVLDVAVASRDANDLAVRAGGTGQVRSFTVTNAGNGTEAFALTAEGRIGGNGFDPEPTAIVIDSNGNGVYEPGVDQAVGTAGATAELEPDASVTIFVLATVPGDAADAARGDLRLNAVARTGSGAAGTVLAGQGAGGGDAIVGATTAKALAKGGFVVARATVSLVKSASVRDPFGGARTVPGSLITYRLAASLTGGGAVAGLKIADPIPAGTRYVAGTLTLDGAALTDAADTDAGVATATGVEVALGTPAAGSNHAVEFTVKVD